MSTHKYSEHPT